MYTVHSENLNKYITWIITLVISILILLLLFSSWKQQTKLTNIEPKLIKLDLLEEHARVATNDTVTIQAAIKSLTEKYNFLTNNTTSNDTEESTASGYQLRSTLRLTTLAAMYLFLGKEDVIAQNLLTQAIAKLIKMNDPRLNPILYNIQDEYTNLSNKGSINYSIEQVWKKIDDIKLLVDKLETPSVDLDGFFSETNKLSYVKIQMLHIYLEQAKLAYLQNNDFLFKQVIKSITASLDLGLWSPQLMLEIKEHINWLSAIDIRTYPLLLQAILNLEDQIKY